MKLILVERDLGRGPSGRIVRPCFIEPLSFALVSQLFYCQTLSEEAKVGAGNR